MKKTCAVYIMTNYSETSLYICVTSNLQKRVWEHKNKVVKGFTEKYNVDKLVYYELTDSIETAINREKQLKRWHRQWKINLIKEMHPKFISDSSASRRERALRRYLIGSFCFPSREK